MEIKKVGSQASVEGPADWFTGTVRIDPLFQAPAPARAGGASVTFEPGARTAWLGLEVKSHHATGADTAEVAFIARFRIGGGHAQRLAERSRFECIEGRWYYRDGDHS